MMRTVLWQALVLVGLAGVCGWLTWKFHPEPPALYRSADAAPVDEISLGRALEMEKSRGVIWVDARSAAAFAKGHVPGAYLLNEQGWPDLVFELVKVMDADEARRPLVIYCDAQKCAASKAVRDRLRHEIPIGDREVHVLHGGWPAWQSGMGG